jgi:hypothetical protein
VDALHEELLTHAVLHADETPVAMLKPGKGKTHKAYLWSYCTTAFNPVKAVIFDFAFAVAEPSGTRLRCASSQSLNFLAIGSACSLRTSGHQGSPDAYGASVSAIALEAGVNANLLFAWRRAHRAATAETPTLLPVTIQAKPEEVSQPAAAAPRACAGSMRMSCGSRGQISPVTSRRMTKSAPRTAPAQGAA